MLLDAATGLVWVFAVWLFLTIVSIVTNIGRSDGVVTDEKKKEIQKKYSEEQERFNRFWGYDDPGVPY